jgi:V8-like Glu-specific endopeptidase
MLVWGCGSERRDGSARSMRYGRRAARLPRRRTLALTGGLTTGLVILLLIPALLGSSALGARLTAATQTFAQDVGLMPGPQVQARTISGTPAVGALFRATGNGRLSNHFCTGSVVDSPQGDLVLTAAHCVSGVAATQIAFVPEYDKGAMPYGIWRVTSVVVDDRWASSADPDDDVAFLVVARRGQQPVEALTGGEHIGIGEHAGQLVRVTGYPAAGNAPITCNNRVTTFSPTQLQFNCGGYTNGTSGSALLTGVNASTGLGTVIGVIGGYEQGGYVAWVSYAARFGANVAALYQEAIRES